MTAERRGGDMVDDGAKGMAGAIRLAAGPSLRARGAGPEVSRFVDDGGKVTLPPATIYIAGGKVSQFSPRLRASLAISRQFYTLGGEASVFPPWWRGGLTISRPDSAFRDCLKI